MAIALTFVDKKLLDTAVVGPDGGVRYTTTTTSGFRGRKITTISAASGLTGYINWREHVFVINGVQREWDSLKSRSGGIFSSCVCFDRLWPPETYCRLESGNGAGGTGPSTSSTTIPIKSSSCVDFSFHLRDEVLTAAGYYLQATPTAGNPADTVRFTTYHSHLLHDSDRAAIYFPHQMVDEIERMFLLMAILQTEIHRQDVRGLHLRGTILS
jgi:hypothetical protein